MFHWQFFITYISFVSLKIQTCYITGQWGQFTVKIRMLFYTDIHILSGMFFIKYLHFILFAPFFWRSIKFPQQNINHSSETRNITLSVTVWMSYFRKNNLQVGRGWLRTWNFQIKCGNSSGQENEFAGVIKKK